MHIAIRRAAHDYEVHIAVADLWCFGSQADDGFCVSPYNKDDQSEWLYKPLILGEAYLCNLEKSNITMS